MPFGSACSSLVIVFNLFRAIPSGISLNSLFLGIRLWPDHTLPIAVLEGLRCSLNGVFHECWGIGILLCPTLRNVKSFSHTLSSLPTSNISNFIWFCLLKGFPIQSPPLRTCSSCYNLCSFLPCSLWRLVLPYRSYAYSKSTLQMK